MTTPLYPENIGENLSLDETCLSNGDVYTILTNKAAKGRKGGFSLQWFVEWPQMRVSGILRRLPGTGNGCLSRLSLQIYLSHDADGQKGVSRRKADQ